MHTQRFGLAALEVPGRLRCAGRPRPALADLAKDLLRKQEESE
jgi:putative membrane protein